MQMEELAMESRSVDSTGVEHQTGPPAVPELRSNCNGADGQAEAANLDDLLIYQPVPPRRVMRIAIESRSPDRGRPLPYVLDEDREE